MGDPVIHFYNVISGKCACGAEIKPEEKSSFTVFPDSVTCESCLKLLGKSEGK